MRERIGHWSNNKTKIQDNLYLHTWWQEWNILSHGDLEK